MHRLISLTHGSRYQAPIGRGVILDTTVDSILLIVFQGYVFAKVSGSATFSLLPSKPQKPLQV
jgi:hypothetical protein